MKIDVSSPRAAIADFERAMTELGAKRIPQTISRVVQAASEQTERKIVQGLKLRLDGVEPITLRSFQSTKPAIMRDEVTGGLRLVEPQAGWIENLIRGGVRLPDGNHNRILIPMRRALESPETRSAGINVRFNRAGNLPRSQQKALVAAGRPSGSRAPYPVRGSVNYPQPGHAFWSKRGNQVGLFLAPGRIKTSDGVRNTGRPRLLVLAARKTKVPPLLAGVVEDAAMEGAQSIGIRLQAAFDRELAKVRP